MLYDVIVLKDYYNTENGDERTVRGRLRVEADSEEEAITQTKEFFNDIHFSTMDSRIVWDYGDMPVEGGVADKPWVYMDFSFTYTGRVVQVEEDEGVEELTGELETVRHLAARLHALMQDPHPGLASWQDAYGSVKRQFLCAWDAWCR